MANRLPKPMFYGVEKYSKYDDPRCTIKRFWREDLGVDWLETQGRSSIMDANGKEYHAFKVLYAMPWYWRPPTKVRATAYLEENNPLMKYHWTLEDIRAEVISKIGRGVS
jgi:hypothetical protein